MGSGRNHARRTATSVGRRAPLATSRCQTATRSRGCSDPGAAEHLAGVLAGQAGVLECVRARAGGAVANQPGLLIARVDVDRPLAVVVVADDPSDRKST